MFRGIVALLAFIAVVSTVEAGGFESLAKLSKWDSLVGEYRGVGVGRSPFEREQYQNGEKNPAEGWRPITVYCNIQGYSPGNLFPNSMGYCEIIGRSNWQSNEATIVPAYPICIYVVDSNEYIAHLDYRNGSCDTPDRNDIQPLIASMDRDAFHTTLLTVTPTEYTDGWIEATWMYRMSNWWDKASSESVYSGYNPFVAD